MTECGTALQRIMLVEDEEDIRAVAELALEAVGGFTVKTCGSGVFALESLDVFKPQLILLDVMMPGMDGPSTLRAIRERSEFENIPVIFITAKVQPEEVKGYLKAGAVDVISKPFDPMRLPEKIRDIWKNLG